MLRVTPSRPAALRLGSQPDVAVCLACAHFLHQQAGQREDALRPSIAGRLRDGARWGRRLVIEGGMASAAAGRAAAALAGPAPALTSGQRLVTGGVLPHRHHLALRDADPGRGRAVGAGLFG